MDSYGRSIKDGLVPVAPAEVSRTDQSISSPLERISVLLSRWSALKMAVQNEWGGPDSFKKYEQLVSDISSWFSQSRGYLNAEDLESLLHERLLLSFNTEIEDGSIEELQNEPNLSPQELSMIKLIQEIPLMRKSYPEGKETLNEADNSFANLDSKIAFAASLKKECILSKEEIKVLQAEEAPVLLAMMETDEQIADLLATILSFITDSSDKDDQKKIMHIPHLGKE